MDQRQRRADALPPAGRAERDHPPGEGPRRRTHPPGAHDGRTGAAGAGRGNPIRSIERLAGYPILAVTHVSLTEVPGGVMNVHGHTHHHQAADAGRQINIRVEQLKYRPGA